MRWSEIDGDLWVIPRERYKNGRANTVPLSDPVQRILSALPRSGEYVFTTTGRTPISGFSKAKAMIDRASGLTGWRLHDLRRTARSLMSRVGISSDIAERVIGHKIPGVAGVYDRHGYVPEKSDALEKLSAEITRIVG
jgi:integrase